MKAEIESAKHRGIVPRIVLYLLTFMILTFLLGPFLYLGFTYFRDDGMTYRLAKYAITGDQGAVREYLLTYHGEADNHNNAIVFLAWGITHQSDFINIVEGVDSEQKSKLCGRLGWAAHDTSQENKFEAGFRNAESDCLDIIRSEIERYRQYK